MRRCRFRGCPPMYSRSAEGAPVTLPDLHRRKRDGEKIVCVTAYEASLAARADEAGVDLVLVGDSLGMVVQGHASTLPVTMDAMVYHTACVARGLHRAFLVADLPFMAFRDVPTALSNAGRLVSEGVTSREVPVCAHLGLTPQSVHRLGGYRVQGRDVAAAERLRADARSVQDAGAQLLVLECVPSALARAIAGELDIPVIGIGAGVDCDGQVLVMHDLLGITSGKRPRFSKDFLHGSGSVVEALAAYARAVRAREFPAAEHSY
jgi:3-methyl-2-oxobutanoate hydroxymethyltransferase